MTHAEAEKLAVAQLAEQWAQHSKNGFVTTRRYPGKITGVNGKSRNVALFKNARGGVLYAEILDVLIYGPAFTVYKVGAGTLHKKGTRNLFAHTKEAREIQIAEFEAIFN